MAKSRRSSSKNKEKQIELDTKKESLTDEANAKEESGTNETETNIEDTIDTDINEVNDVKTVDVNNLNYVNQVLKEAKSFEYIYEKLKDNLMLAPMLDSINRYVENVYKKNPNDYNTISIMTSDLLNTIKNVMSEENYGVFKVKNDVLNRIFYLERKSRFNPVSLMRYDFHWTINLNGKQLYMIYIEFLHNMSDNTKVNNFKKIFNKDVLFNKIDQNAVRNITKYYKL